MKLKDSLSLAFRTVKSNKLRKSITYQEAKLFKERYTFPARVSISLVGPRNVVVNDDKIKTNPNISMQGVDENYLLQSGYTLSGGRNFNKLDVESGRSICILGNSVALKLYGENTQRALD